MSVFFSGEILHQPADKAGPERFTVRAEVSFPNLAEARVFSNILHDFIKAQINSHGGNLRSIGERRTLMTLDEFTASLKN